MNRAGNIWGVKYNLAKGFEILYVLPWLLATDHLSSAIGKARSSGVRRVNKAASDYTSAQNIGHEAVVIFNRTAPFFLKDIFPLQKKLFLNTNDISQDY
jgi:hypothetical protein